MGLLYLIGVWCEVVAKNGLNLDEKMEVFEKGLPALTNSKAIKAGALLQYCTETGYGAVFCQKLIGVVQHAPQMMQAGLARPLPRELPVMRRDTAFSNEWPCFVSSRCAKGSGTVAGSHMGTFCIAFLYLAIAVHKYSYFFQWRILKRRTHYARPKVKAMLALVQTTATTSQCKRYEARSSCGVRAARNDTRGETSRTFRKRGLRSTARRLSPRGNPRSSNTHLDLAVLPHFGALRPRFGACFGSCTPCHGGRSCNVSGLGGANVLTRHLLRLCNQRVPWPATSWFQLER